MLAGCIGGQGPPAGTATETAGGTPGGSGTITLGAAISSTGDLSTEGKLYRDSYRMTVKDINENGGFEVNGTNYEFELKLYDDESDPSTSRELFQRLINQDEVQYLLGPYSSGVTLAAKPVVLQNELPMVEGGGASLEIFQDQNWIFGVLAPAPKYATTAMSLARTFSDPGVTDVAIATENEAFSKNALDAGAMPMANELGWNVAVNEVFPSGTNDLSSILNKVQNASPQLLLMLGHYRHATLLAKQMKQLRVTVPMAHSTVGVTPNKFIQELGSTGNYFYGPSQWDNEAEYDGFFYGSAQDYVNRFQQEYDYSPDYHNAAGSAAILVYMDAFQRADSLDPAHIRDKLAETDINTFYGPLRFQTEPNFGVLDRDMFLYQWQDQQKRLVFPEAVARADPVYPMPDWSAR